MARYAILRNIDLPMLLEQKQELLKVLGTLSKDNILNGLLYVLDDIHDQLDPPKDLYKG